jgi:restriction system protein
VRAGKYGENESYALEKSVVVIGWDDLDDIGALQTREQIAELMAATYSDVKPTTLPIWTGEVLAFKERIKEDDLVVLPLKTRSALAIGRPVGPYRFDAQAPEGAKHQRKVTWIRTDVPRSEVADQDILLSLGSTLTVFQVRRPDAEKRIIDIAEGRRSGSQKPTVEGDISISAEEIPDLEVYARDQISSVLARKFRTHDLARLVGEILKAQGYKVLVSPPGADGGVDIIAGQGP